MIRAAKPNQGQTYFIRLGLSSLFISNSLWALRGSASFRMARECDYAGFAPFGFGYRRCPGEQLTIQVFEDFLRKVWKDNIEFQKLDIASPEPLPIGPTTVIGDNVGFIRVA